MPTPKKLNLLDRLYKVYKESNGTAASQTDRINFLYREGGYQDKVNRLLSDKSNLEKNANRAKREIARFHEDIFPNEMELFFENNPHLHHEKDFDKAFDAVKANVGELGNDELAAKKRIANQWFGKTNKQDNVESWKFTNDKDQDEFGSKQGILDYLKDLPDIVWPHIGFVRQVRKDGREQLYIPTVKKVYPSKEYVPTLVKYNPEPIQEQNAKENLAEEWMANFGDGSDTMNR